MKNKQTILVQSAPFCFGPVATTLNVVNALIEKEYPMIVIDEGPTGDLTRRARLAVETVSISTILPFSLELLSLLEQVDWVISNTDPAFATACRELGKKVVVIDTLFWMWDHLPPGLLESDLYIIQSFEGIENQLKRLGYPQNYYCVGPLAAPQEQPVVAAERKNLIHISFGGCDCAMVDPEQDPYPPFILAILEKAAAEALPRDYNVIISCGERMARQLKPSDPRIAVCTLSNQEYLDTMRCAKGILLSPGLTGSMEVFEAQTPVFFLPPQNYSQVLQLEAYRSAQAAPSSYTWSDTYQDFKLPSYLPEEVAVERVREVINRAVSDPQVGDTLKRQLVRFFREDIRNFNPAPGRQFRERFGMGGSEQAARIIDDFLKKS